MHALFGEVKAMPVDALLRGILSVIGTGALVASASYILLWSYKNPEKVQKWLELTKGLRIRLCRGIRHKWIAWRYNRTFGDPIAATNEEIGGMMPKKIGMEFVDPEKYGEDFVRVEILNGAIHIVKAWDTDIQRCFQAITYAYFSKGTLQGIRPFMNPNYMMGLDFALTLSVLSSSKKRGPLLSFLKEVIRPLFQRDRNDQLRKYYEKFRNLDGAGLLTTILARELHFVEKSVLGSKSPEGISQEPESLLVFLDKIRHKERGDRVELDFEGNIVSFGVVLVGSSLTKFFGKIPYIDRIRKKLEKFPRVYVWGVGESNRNIINEIKIYEFRGTATAYFRKEYYTNNFRILPSRILQITR